MSRLDDKLAGLANLTPAELRTEWQRLYRTPPPRISPDLMTRGIAWLLQERALGGLAPAVARELKRLAAIGPADARSTVASSAPPKAHDLRPGTTLMRSWGDRSWSVLVTEDGLVFEGRHYDSLSKIAREITGAHWSGPRFFGLRAASVNAGASTSAKRDKGRAQAHA